MWNRMPQSRTCVEYLHGQPLVGPLKHAPCNRWRGLEGDWQLMRLTLVSILLVLGVVVALGTAFVGIRKPLPQAGRNSIPLRNSHIDKWRASYGRAAKAPSHASFTHGWVVDSTVLLSHGDPKVIGGIVTAGTTRALWIHESGWPARAVCWIVKSAGSDDGAPRAATLSYSDAQFIWSGIVINALTCWCVTCMIALAIHTCWRRWRHLGGKCKSCGYDVRGLCRCPECGTDVRQAIWRC